MDKLELLLLISGFNFVYILGLISLGYQYKKMTEEIPYDGSTLNLMKQNAKRIKKALRIETIAGLFMMPIAIVGGILFRQFSEGYTLSEILQKQDLLLFTLGLVVIIPPLLSWITSKMNDSAYGSYIRELDANIAKMEELV